MTRNITQTFRTAAQSSFADEVDLIFLTITHPQINPSLHVVNDTIDYVLSGTTYIGFPFDIEILSDDEQPPTARLSIQNVDPRIGDSVRSLMTPPMLAISLYSSADFNLSVIPRVAIGTPTVIYSTGNLFLTNLSVDVLTVTGTIVGWDYQQRVWPSERGSIANFPGLFRA